MESKTTEKLAEFAAGFTYEDLPEAVRSHARNLLIDSVACALAADFSDETRVFADFARTAGGPGESTIIGSDERMSLLGAVMLNGFQITAATVCDTYVPAHVHITPEIIPPALVIAERDGSDGRSLLAAIAVGSEVAVRVAAGINYKVAGPMGWHMPGIVGPFGAATAVGRLLGLNPIQLRNAMGLAGSQSAGTWASWGTPSVKFHQARGAASGLIAGLLAQQDFISSDDILTHSDGGMLAAYSDGGIPEAILADIGTRFEMEEIALRLWPGGTPLQPTLTAVFNLIAEQKPDFTAIDRIRIEVAPDVHEAHARFDQPQGTFEALLSYHFAVSAALRDRAFWLDSLSEAQLEDADFKRFMKERIDLVAEPRLTREKSRITLAMSDGRTLKSMADAAKGTRANPVSLSDLRVKFENCSAGRLNAFQIDELLGLLARVDDADDLKPLFALLRSAGSRSVLS